MLLAVFRLAFLFQRPVSELNISRREFHAWLAYLKLEPPNESDDYRTAALMSQVTNMAGRSLPGRKMLSPDDFIGRKKTIQTQADQKAFLRGITEANNG